MQRFELKGASGEEGFDAWRALVRPLFAVDTVKTTAGFRGEASVFVSDQMLLARSAASPLRFKRDKHLLRECDWDHIMVQLYESGGYRGLAGQNDLALGTGALGILDLSRTFETRAASFSNLTLLIPRQRWADLKYKNLAARLIHGSVIHNTESGVAATLTSLLRAMADHASDMTPDEFDNALDGVLSTLDGDDTSAAARATMRARLIETIDHTLHGKDLDTTVLAAMCGTSRSSLYRVDEIDGGIASLVRRRRLDRARNLLAQRGPAALPISDIAVAAGFSGAQHFAHAFRRAYNISPREFRRLVWAGHTPDVLVRDRRLTDWIGAMRRLRSLA